MQKLKGLWIPAKILYDKQLSDKEKLILAITIYLNQEDKGFFASNKYIANIVNITPQRVSKIISSLRNKGYIRVKLKYKKDSKEIEERQITSIVKNIDRYNQDNGEDIDNIDYSGSQKQQLPIIENDKDIINTKNIKDNNKNRDISIYIKSIIMTMLIGVHTTQIIKESYSSL